MSVDRSPAEVAFGRLVQIMRRLRDPGGCPWDREQDFGSLRRYVLEEAYEVVQAIDDGDLELLVGELGDLLLQVVFLSQLGAEVDAFDVEAVISAICDKLVRRHPHVFGEQQVETSEEVLHRWEMIKLDERGGGSVLDDLPAVLPALARAEKVGRRAAQLGFDWTSSGRVLEKVREELVELEQAMSEGAEPTDDGGLCAAPTDVEEELGDLLFAVANLARHLGLSPEVVLLRASEKFERRFRRIEPQISAGTTKDQAAMERLWEGVKSGDSEDT